MPEKYPTPTYNVRVQRIDGTRRLLLGQTGRLPPVGKVIKIPTGRGAPLVAKIVAHPRSPGEPAEATELDSQPSGTLAI